MKKKLFAIGFLLLSLLLAGYTIPEQSREFFFYDEVGILSREDRDYIVNVNLDLREKTKGEVVVAIVKSTEGMDISQAAVEIFEKWKIGDRDLNNGVLILYAIEDRKFKLETGYGVEGFIPDGLSGRIMRSGVEYFPQENYDSSSIQNSMYSKGILESFNQVIAQYEGEYGVEIDSNPPENIYQEESNVSVGEILFIMIVLFIIFSNFGGFGGPRGRNRRYRTYPRYPRYPGGFGGGSGGFGGHSGGGGRSGGGGASGGW